MGPPWQIDWVRSAQADRDTLPWTARDLVSAVRPELVTVGPYFRGIDNIPDLPDGCWIEASRSTGPGCAHVSTFTTAEAGPGTPSSVARPTRSFLSRNCSGSSPAPHPADEPAHSFAWLRRSLPQRSAISQAAHEAARRPPGPGGRRRCPVRPLRQASTETGLSQQRLWLTSGGNGASRSAVPDLAAQGRHGGLHREDGFLTGHREDTLRPS